MKELIKLSKEEINNRMGKTIYDKVITILKALVLMISIWIMLEKFMGYDELVNSHPYYMWLLSGIIPCFYMFDVIYRVINNKRNISHRVINLSSFIIFTILTFVEMVLFRIAGFNIDIYYIQIIIYMIFSYIFMELCSYILDKFNNICEWINKVIGIFVLPVFMFSGVFYNASDVPNRYLRTLLRLDPINYLVNGFRNAFVNKKWIFDEPKKFAYFSGICLILIIVSFILNKINKKK